MNININGININYYDTGKAELRGGLTVVFLHGWGVDYSYFLPVVERIKKTIRVCALDLPGFGGSDEPPVAWGVGDYADFTRSFLSGMGVKSAVLIGHSFGGRIAIKLAARSSSDKDGLEIPKIVLVDSAGIRPKKSAKRKIKDIFYKIVRQILSTDFIRKKYPRALEKWRVKNGSSDYRNASPRMRECLVKVVSEDMTPILPRVSCPALLVWGENDTATPLRDAHVMENLIPDAGLVVLRGAGHYSFIEQSGVFAAVLDSFLNTQESAT
ncbi:2-hydroxy-6-oxohepta-2,4-dienoate hydrolase [Synergistales bacterium]|nr:2-hydroxy-6-oxohepta-2,4-dienoate hydrolase [Synergistales bacterium]